MATLRRLIVVALGVLGCGRGDGAKLALRYHPPAGATYHYSLEQHTDMKFEGGPMAQVPAQQMTMHVAFTQTVTGPTDGGVGVTIRFDSTTMDSPLMPASEFRPMLDRMRGVTSNVVYDDRMNVVRSELSSEGKAFSPVAEQLVRNIREGALPLPPRPVGVGDSWTAEVELPMRQLAGDGPGMNAKTKMTVKEIHAEGPDTTVLVALETTFPGDPIKVAQQGQTLTLKLSGTLTGEQLFSVSRGAVVRSSRGGTMRVHMAGGPVGPDGAEMTAKQATSLQLREAK